MDTVSYIFECCGCVCSIELCCKLLRLYSARGWMNECGEMLDMDNWNTQSKTSPSATLSTIYPTWTSLGLNLSLCSVWWLTTWAIAWLHMDVVLWSHILFQYNSIRNVLKGHTFQHMEPPDVIGLYQWSPCLKQLLRKLPLKCTVVLVGSGPVMVLYHCMLLSMEWHDKTMESEM